MKKAIIPIIGAILSPVIFMQINPGIQAAGILITVALGLGIGALVNGLIFKKENAKENTETHAE